MRELKESIPRCCTKQLLMDQTKDGLSIPGEVQNNCLWTRQMNDSIPDDARNNCWWIIIMKDYPYQMIYKQLLMEERTEGIHARWSTKQLDGSDQWRTCHIRWGTKQLLMDERDKKIHTRWCTTQLLMDETNEGLPIPDHIQTTVDGCESWRNPCQMTYETTVDESDQRRTYHTRWCTKQLLMDEIDKEIHTRWCTKQLLMYETNQGQPIPHDVQTTVGGWENWRNPCQMMYEATGSDQRGTYHTRWSTKQMMMDEADKEYHLRWCPKQLRMDEIDNRFHTRWCTKEMLIDDANEGLPISYDV